MPRCPGGAPCAKLTTRSRDRGGGSESFRRQDSKTPRREFFSRSAKKASSWSLGVLAAIPSRRPLRSPRVMRRRGRRREGARDRGCACLVEEAHLVTAVALDRSPHHRRRLRDRLPHRHGSRRRRQFERRGAHNHERQRVSRRPRPRRWRRHRDRLVRRAARSVVGVMRRRWPLVAQQAVEHHVMELLALLDVLPFCALTGHAELLEHVL